MAVLNEGGDAGTEQHYLAVMLRVHIDRLPRQDASARSLVPGSWVEDLILPIHRKYLANFCALDSGILGFECM